MSWFKRKKKEQEPQKPDFSKYKVKINGKVMCAYEAMTGKPFLKIQTEDEIKHLFYCSLVFNNTEFETLDYSVCEFIQQFKTDVTKEENEEEDQEGEDKTFFMLEAISSLIVKMGMDPNYVMYDMQQWEIAYYYRVMRDIERERLTEERLWTYLQILPHVGKKLGSPEKMLPFEWERNNNKVQRELEHNTQAAVAFLSRARKNGKGEPNNNTEQA